MFGIFDIFFSLQLVRFLSPLQEGVNKLINLFKIETKWKCTLALHPTPPPLPTSFAPYSKYAFYAWENVRRAAFLANESACSTAGHSPFSTGGSQGTILQELGSSDKDYISVADEVTILALRFNCCKYYSWTSSSAYLV